MKKDMKKNSLLLILLYNGAFGYYIITFGYNILLIAINTLIMLLLFTVTLRYESKIYEIIEELETMKR